MTIFRSRPPFFCEASAHWVKKMGGSANILVFQSRMRVIYAATNRSAKRSRRSPTPVPNTSGPALPLAGEAVPLETADGGDYLVCFYGVPSGSMLVKYLITYCPISEIGGWVRDASVLVLVISSLFALLALAALWITARGITRPLQRLCRESERIGGGGFEEIAQSFPLLELEELRLAMNRMVQKLKLSDEAQRDFFQNVSHDLRTPLMSIGGYAQGIERGLFRSPGEAAHTILEESVRLTGRVNSLLDLSRLESGQNGGVLGPVRIAGPVEDCLDRVNGLAIEEGITLSLPSFDHSLYVEGEYELVCKVLENLLTNAIRYAKKTVTMSMTTKTGLISITVSDDGEGISEKDLPYLFDRCYRGKGGNLGIGLTIARSAAQNMGGELKAANLPVGGAVFTLVLNAAKRDEHGRPQ